MQQHSSDIQVRFCVSHLSMLLHLCDTYSDDYRCFSGGQVKQKHEPLISIINRTHQLFTFHMHVGTLFFNSIFKDQIFSITFTSVQ